jgi:hypothetical protein
MLSIVYADCHFAECQIKAPYAECCYAVRRYADKCTSLLELGENVL